MAAEAFEGAAEIRRLLSDAPAGAKHQFLRDTVARIAIDQAALHTKGNDAAQPRQQVNQALEQAVALLQHGWAPILLESGFDSPLRLGEESTASGFSLHLPA
jgi:hypothetical protein